jgi:serine/threonine-protein kinase
MTRDPDWDALPPNTLPHVRRLMERCLRKDPKKRLRDIGEARLALDEAPPTPAEPPRIKARTSGLGTCRFSGSGIPSRLADGSR